MGTGVAMSYVFISYARKDYHFVERLRASLDDAGISYWIDHEELATGTPNWERAIKQAIKDCDLVIWVVTPESYSSEYVQGEIVYAESYQRKIFPVWAGGDNWIDCVPLERTRIQYIDMRGGNYNLGLAELIKALGGEKPELAVPQEPEPQLVPEAQRRNPYKGLVAFYEVDARDFFGREALVSILKKRVEERLGDGRQRFLAVLGPSGAGKSSVVMAGLIPMLKKAHPDWHFLPRMVPGTHPVEKLADILYQVLPDKSLSSIEGDLNSPGGRYLHRLAKQIGERVVLYIDQFEELFTLTRDEAERQQFISLITHAATEADGTVLVLLSMRADFYGHPMNYAQLGTLIEENQKTVLPMNIRELSDAIEKPARLPDVGLTFDPGLVADIIYALREKDMAQAGALPLLQFTLERLYAMREGNRLTSAAYETIGGVQGAIGTHCEAVFSQLPETVQQQLGTVFLPLVSIDPDTGEATRRRTSLERVTTAPEARALVDALVRNRLLQTGMDGQQNYVEIAHEALFRSWARLAEWIESVREDLLLLRQVRAAAAEWDAAGRPDYMLWPAERLSKVAPMLETLQPELTEVERDYLRSEEERILEELATRYMEDHTYKTRIDRIREIGGDEIQAHITGLQQHNEDILRAAAEGLTQLNSPRATAPLREALHRKLDWYARSTIVDALGSLQSLEAIPDIVTVLQSDELDSYGFVRSSAARALAQLRTQEAIETLLNALQSSTDRRVIGAAARELGRLRLQEAIEPLIHALQSGEHEEVRVSAADALGMLKAKQAIEPLIHALQHDEHEDVRRSAAEALGTLRAQEAVEALISRLEHEREDFARSSAAQALGKLKAQQAVIPLLKALQHDRGKYVRSSAAEALSQLGAQQAIEPLLYALQHDRDDSVRSNAAKALGKLKAQQAIEPLIHALQHDERDEVRGSAAEALADLKAEQVIEPLLQALQQTKSSNVRSSAARALAKLNAQQAIEPLIDALQHESREFVRSSAAEALADLQAQQAMEPLIDALQRDPNDDTRSDVAKALGKLGAPQAIAPLMHVVEHDKNPLVRSSAACALGTMNSHEAIPQLVNALLNDHEKHNTYTSGTVSSTTAAALMRISGVEIEHIFREFKDERLIRMFVVAFEYMDDEHEDRPYLAAALRLIGTPEALEAVAKWEAEQQESDEA